MNEVGVGGGRGEGGLAVSYKMYVHDAAFSLYFENPRSLEVLRRLNVRPSLLKARMAFYTKLITLL